MRNRSQDGRAGGWLVTPLTLASGEQVAIIRGFVGLADDSLLDPSHRRPAGRSR